MPNNINVPIAAATVTEVPTAESAGSVDIISQSDVWFIDASDTPVRTDTGWRRVGSAVTTDINHKLWLYCEFATTARIDFNKASASSSATEATLLKTVGLGIPQYDYMAVTYNTTSDVYAYRLGGSSGTLVATVTVTYSDSTKTKVQTVAKV